MADGAKSYTVKEILYTLVSEGVHAGRPAIFCRFTGCNLWSGREEDRSTAICKFCDVNFRGVDGQAGGRYTAEELANVVKEKWPSAGKLRARPFVVLIGGEPTLQVDEPLIEAFHAQGFEVGMESNGTAIPAAGLDWLTISPKMGSTLVTTSGDELKLVYPQEGGDPAQFAEMDFKHFFVQPLDGPERDKNTQLAIAYCKDNPQWRLSLQTHKFTHLR